MAVPAIRHMLDPHHLPVIDRSHCADPFDLYLGNHSEAPGKKGRTSKAGRMVVWVEAGQSARTFQAACRLDRDRSRARRCCRLIVAKSAKGSMTEPTLSGHVRRVLTDAPRSETMVRSHWPPMTYWPPWVSPFKGRLRLRLIKRRLKVRVVPWLVFRLLARPVKLFSELGYDLIQMFLFFKKGVYVSNISKQEQFFGPAPTPRDAITRWARSNQLIS
ncbi:hypothetical protein [Rhizobium sp. LC145]|uniref:hypothetical protein n=1 Tax=Rhizobium sp. LC145 TaxID=1120688 RepID=UPI001FD950F5|nr:hypothetical protein [Rhizobium sp. LC145]